MTDGKPGRPLNQWRRDEGERLMWVEEMISRLLAELRDEAAALADSGDPYHRVQGVAYGHVRQVLANILNRSHLPGGGPMVDHVAAIRRHLDALAEEVDTAQAIIAIRNIGTSYTAAGKGPGVVPPGPVLKALADRLGPPSVTVTTAAEGGLTLASVRDNPPGGQPF